MTRLKYLKKQRIIKSLLNNFNDEEAEEINFKNEKILSKELKNIIKKNNNNNNISGSGSSLKRKPIITSVLLNGVQKKK